MALAAIVLLALVLELPTINMGRWLDECLNVASAAQPDMQTLITTMYGRLEDQHPPLSYMLLFCFIRLFGTGDIAIRIPSVLCGLLLIPATYWLGKTVHSTAAGLLAAFFVAVSPFANYMLCQSRPYALAALISAVTLTLFCKLVEQRSATKKTGVTFLCLSLTAAALCYTEYSSCPMIPALAIASVVIYLRDRFSGIAPPQASARLARCLAALFLSGLLFIPWVPSVLMQSRVGAPLMESTPLFNLPLAVAYNVLLTTVPLPMLVAIPLGVCAAVAAFIFLCRPSRRLPSFKSLICSIPSACWVLLCAVALPACIMELIIPFWFGYYRYMFPYSPAGFVLSAIVMLRLFGYWKEGSKRNMLLPITLAAMLAVNILYLGWFDSRPQSGLKTLAQDALAGKYDGCALLIAPDYISQTLDYYLPLNERIAHHIDLHGFPRWDKPMAPVKMNEIPPMWSSKTVVGETEQHLADLQKQGWRKLAFAIDDGTLDRQHSGAACPRGQRVNALRTFIEQNYKMLSAEKKYAGVTEAVSVSIYQLEPLR